MGLNVAIRHAFGTFRMVVDFAAPSGVVALFGRSGAGKSTVVNAVAGLLRPDAGRIVVDGATLLDTEHGISTPRHLHRIGYVFQDGRLFPHLSVRQNLAFGGWFAPREAARPDFGYVVDLLGIGHLLARRPGLLSGGEKQRVAIGRALLSAPRMLLMDEPLASLDEARKAEILPYLERMRDAGGVPILYVTHSLSEVARLAQYVVILREGRVLRAGPAQDVLSDPASAPMLGVREAGAVVAGRVAGHDADGLTRLDTSAGPLLLPWIDAAVGTSLRLRIHAQDVILSRSRPDGLSALNILPANVTGVRLGEGPGAMVQLRAGDDLLLARITHRSAEALALAPGTEVFAILKSVAVAPGDIGTVAEIGP